MSDQQAPKPPPRQSQLLNEQTPDGRLKVPVVRDAAYCYLVPHLVSTSLVGEGPIPRVQIRLLRRDRRTQTLEVAQEAGPTRYRTADIDTMVDLGTVEVDLAQAVQLAQSLFNRLDMLPPEILRGAGLQSEEGPPSEGQDGGHKEGERGP